LYGHPSGVGTLIGITKNISDVKLKAKVMFSYTSVTSTAASPHSGSATNLTSPHPSGNTEDFVGSTSAWSVTYSNPVMLNGQPNAVYPENNKMKHTSRCGMTHPFPFEPSFIRH
jgi:hypothetical protein